MPKYTRGLPDICFSASSLHFLTYFSTAEQLFLLKLPETFSWISSATHCSPLHCTLYRLLSLLLSLLAFFSPPPPPPLPPPPLHPPSSKPFTLTVFVALIANESQNLSALRTCTTYLCVGQRFKDESLSTQRLYMHAFAFKNSEPDRHPRRDC